MRLMRTLAVGSLALLGAWTSTAEAGGYWSVGVRFGGPCYYRPWGYYPCYRPYPIVGIGVGVAPVVVEPVPVIQTVPVYQVPAAAPAPAPEVAPPPTPVTSQGLPAQPIPVAVQPVSNNHERQADITFHLQRLADPDVQHRAESAVQLGRMRAQRAVDPLTATLAGDQSPVAREAAARALGLIGNVRAMPALRRAAQADADATVRSSATFAMDVIQARR